MANSTSDNLKLTVQATGENSGTWGQITNTNLLILEQAIGGYSSIALNATTGATLTFSNGALSDGKNQVIKLTGTITGNVDVVVPDSVEKTYVIENATSGAFTVTVKTTSGTGVTWGTTDKGTKMVYSDGTNVVDTAFTDVSSDINPQLSGNLDANGNNIEFDDATGITDDSQQEQLTFSKTASAVNNIQIKNAATSSAPEISAIGDDTNIDLTITPKGDGNVVLDGLKYPNADGSADQLLKTDGSGNLSFVDAAGGTDWQSTIVTGTTLSAVAGNGYWIDTTSNACTITFPGSASVGDTIELVDYARTWGTNSITINTNGLNYQGLVGSSPEYNDSGQHLRIVYSGATKGWIPTDDDPTTNKDVVGVEYLLVGGGGAGGAGEGGGGGAGGYLTNYTVSTLNFARGETYTITVGGGGSGVPGSPKQVGTSGFNSVISGTGISTIEAFGGGGGGGNGLDGVDGGSGGGCSASANGGSGTAGQGNDGGTGSRCGGGGAGVAAADGTETNGGNGLQSSIDGTATYYGGGGGGGHAPTTGGLGGGTGGVNNPNSSSPSPANSGGGTGGCNDFSTGNGGSGICILRIPTAEYTGSVTGAPTVSVDGTDTVVKFTGNGTYTA